MIRNYNHYPFMLEIILPGLPRMTNPSGRSGHWRVIKNERDSWIKSVKSVIGTHKPPAPLKRAFLTLVRYSSTSPDPDGLVSGFKAIVDGLVRCGVLADDKFTNIGMPVYLWEKVPRGEGRVRIVVHEIEGEE